MEEASCDRDYEGDRILSGGGLSPEVSREEPWRVQLSFPSRLNINPRKRVFERRAGKLNCELPAASCSTTVMREPTPPCPTDVLAIDAGSRNMFMRALVLLWGICLAV